ncbi:hypothetical protein [Roseibium aggregatum]|uniref:hypothetical protein n=1 Tax=Roseibium aggregatum TaxID=187304 RepID=UPI0025AD6B47|nr:hypothetical protein [Roseibium aggregatum]WJS05815.1 hypothetical protein QUB73_27725 [Roseibium aggregatum]
MQVTLKKLVELEEMAASGAQARKNYERLKHRIRDMIAVVSANAAWNKSLPEEASVPESDGLDTLVRGAGEGPATQLSNCLRELEQQSETVGGKLAGIDWKRFAETKF